MRPKVKLLTVVWGDEYIERFATLALPSFLAPGNLPTLAQATELEVLIMTAERNIRQFEQYAAIRKLREMCPVRFIDIQDLIVDAVYGVTLTLAYARAVIGTGGEMLHTFFIFMNADFLLADGSLRSLCKHIFDGRSIVLAPSFRATAEAVEPALRDELDRSRHTLAIPPRRLVAISLAHPHPTTFAKIVNQQAWHSLHPNQFFWQVDSQTLLGHYYLSFMLCLKPERLMNTVNSFCDYGFIPEMCPSGDEVMMSDSDEFFMLELQSREQELFFLRKGPASESDIARSLSEWSTPEHRRAAKYAVLFHAEELPAEVEQVNADATAFLARIHRKLGPAKSHVHHWYWVGAIAVFRRLRKQKGMRSSPRELGTRLSNRSLIGFYCQIYWRSTIMWARSLPSIAHTLVLGRAPHVTFFHPDWLDYRLLRAVVANLLATSTARVLAVQEKSPFADDLRRLDASLTVVTPGELSTLRMLPARKHFYTHVLVYLRRTNSEHTRNIVEQCQKVMAERSSCYVFIHPMRDDSPDDPSILERKEYFSGKMGTAASLPRSRFSADQYLIALKGWAPEAAAVAVISSGLKHFHRDLLTKLGNHWRRFGKRAVVWIVPILSLELPLLAISNLILSMRRPGSQIGRHSSSLLIKALERGER